MPQVSALLGPINVKILSDHQKNSSLLPVSRVYPQRRKYRREGVVTGSSFINRSVKKITVIPTQGKILFLALIPALLGSIILAIVPVPYVAEGEGLTYDTLGLTDSGEQVITVDNKPPYRGTGHLNMTTVGIHLSISFSEAIADWLSGDYEILPRELFIPPSQDEDDLNKVYTKEFQSSTNDAISAALAYLHQPASAHNIRFGLNGIGGPSAGLMFALAIVVKITGQDLTAGNFIAGTGQIDNTGAVHPIGGIGFKIKSAAKAGATIFLVPADNCREALAAKVKGITLLSIDNLTQAIDQLHTVARGEPAHICQQ